MINMDTVKDVLKNITENLSFEKFVWAIVILVLLIVMSKVLSLIVAKAVMKTKITEGLKRFIVNIFRYVLYFISILIVCDYIGLPVTSLLAVFSLLGLAISLSVQGLLSNLLSGVTVLMLRPFDIGDFIETEVAGTVKNIGLFYTEILTPDNKKVFIPNDKLMANKLINYNAEGTRRLELEFNAGYEFDPEAVKSALKDAVESVDKILNEPEPMIGIKNYGDSAVIYGVWAWVNATEYFDAKFKLMEAVNREYKKNEIKMAYNVLQVEMRNQGGNGNG